MAPDIIIINQGLWSFPELRRNDDYRTEFATALTNITKHVVWKKTTSRCAGDQDEIDDEDFLRDMRHHGIEVFDAYKLTLGVALKHSDDTKNVCWDRDYHFNPFVYRELNKQLLKFLGTHFILEPPPSLTAKA